MRYYKNFYAIISSILTLAIFVVGEYSNNGGGSTNSIKKTSKSGDSSNARSREQNYNEISCVQCASPRNVIKNVTMLEAMDQLFEIRGTNFPYGAVDPNCGRKYNLSMVPYREKCRYPYCITLTFNDKKGTPLIVRGCAESFMASSKLQRSDRGYCQKVHKQLDITECICRNSDSCSPNSSSILSSNVLISAFISSFFILLFSYSD